ncbi:MAG: amino acid transporter permease [Oscillospiraceae bacterium]|jgi:polar amino acid transport system permease protein|nr:amino acid transporter permease [Oscillospiraceae bacterium]
MSLEYISKILPLLLKGAGTTLSLFFIVIVLAIPLGFIVTLLAKSKFPPLRWLSNTYIFVMRGTPLLLQLVFIFFGFPIIGIFLNNTFDAPMLANLFRLERFQAAVLGFTLNYAAYFAEIFRGGLLAIDKGQYEAAKVLGFSRYHTTTKIIFPQMIRVALPAVTNESITLIKDTALLYAVAVPELLHFAQAAVNRDFNLTPLFIAALIYLVLVFVLTIFFKWLEKRFRFQ